MKQQGYMLETPSMHQYVLRENLSAAVNQQATEREPQRLIRPAPKRRRIAPKTSEGFHYDAPVRGWKRVIKDGQAWCTDCEEWKSLTDFDNVNDMPYHYCKVCRRFHRAMCRYRITRQEAVRLYAIEKCACCGVSFKNQRHQHIHHAGGKVIGLVCLTCNHILRDESTEHLRRLECCVRFIKDRVKIESELRGDTQR